MSFLQLWKRKANDPGTVKSTKIAGAGRGYSSVNSLVAVVAFPVITPSSEFAQGSGYMKAASPKDN